MDDIRELRIEWQRSIDRQPLAAKGNISLVAGAPQHVLVPMLSLVGVILDALGGLYLAYDLLGGRHGPLRTFTKSVSYGVMFGTVYALPLGVWFGLAGLLASGPALSIEIRQRGASKAHPFFEALAFGLLRAASFGAAGWFSKDPRFGISFGILSAVGLVGAYLILGPPTVIGSKHPRINKLVVRRAVFRGGSIGLAALVAGLTSKESHAFVYGVEVGLVTGTASGLLLAVAPSVEAWVNKLPDRRLGGYGAILVLIGSLLQTIQYVLPLLGQPIL